MDKTINLNQAATLIRAVGTSNTILLRGQPGVGKSSILASLARELPDYKPCYIDVANLDLGDLAMPVVDKDSMTTSYAPNARFGISRGSKQPVLLMLDELGKASRPVLNMLLPVILEHRLGDVKLPTGSIVFATTNLDTDGVGDNIPAHAYNRMTVLNVANPTSEQWIAWAQGNDVAPVVLAFANEYPSIFDCYTDLDDDVTNPYIFNPRKGVTKAFCSPRSLEKASNIVKQQEVLGDALYPALVGTLGENAANDLYALISLESTLPRFEQIVKAPDTTRVPAVNESAAHFILAFMLAGRSTPDNLSAIVQYVNRWEHFEGQALFINALAGNSQKVTFACRNNDAVAMLAKFGKYF